MQNFLVRGMLSRDAHEFPTARRVSPDQRLSGYIISTWNLSQKLLEKNGLVIDPLTLDVTGFFFMQVGALVPVHEDILDVIDFCLGAAYSHGGTLFWGFVKPFVHIKGLAMLSCDGIFFPSALPLHDIVDGLICDRNII